MNQKATFHNSSLFKTIGLRYEDESFFIFDKPPGLLVVPAAGKEANTLTSIVNRQLSPLGHTKLYPCHRIDKETSGLIIYARGKRNQQQMMDLFRQRKIEKKYIAFVHGSLKNQKGVFDTILEDYAQKKYKQKTVKKSARTVYRVLERLKVFTVVEVCPETGRKNQIRIHFSGEQHPLVGERKFAVAKDYAVKFRRTALHAGMLRFKHPLTGEVIDVKADLPRDMKTLLETYREKRGGGGGRNRY